MNSSASARDKLTPVMRQFYDIKARYPDKILFFRMGDFYEMFDDDAVRAAPILNIALTSRGHLNGRKIPLAGVPYHSADKYLARLLEAGEKVVIVEQVEDPKLAKGVVKRDVVEIITPGTATVESAYESSGTIYLAAVFVSSDDGDCGLAVIDLTTGYFFVDEGPPDRIVETIHILSPREVLYPDDYRGGLLDFIKTGEPKSLTSFENWNFDYKTAMRELCGFFDVSTLDGFGIGHMKFGIIAAGAIYRYLLETNRTKLDHVTKISPADNAHCMVLDYNTVRNLEIAANLSDRTEKNSLYAAVNKTSSPGGARKLKDALLHPYKTLAPILRRQNGVKELYHNRNLALELPSILSPLPDLARLAGRLGMRKINPRLLASLKRGLELGRDVIGRLAVCQSEIIKSITAGYPNLDEIIRKIDAALTEEPPLAANKGGVIRKGYSTELDSLLNSIRDARKYIASLQNIERQRTGIPSLKVGYNKVFGYYIEITKTHLDKVPKDYIRKQTLVNGERYVTEELKQKEEMISAAEEKIFSLEEKLFAALVDDIAQCLEDIILASESLSEIDVIVSLANLAAEKMYVCPEMNEATALEIIGGRHPVIENLLPAGNFIANDLSLGADTRRLMILTGPNMSGKSTYLRQIGLIVILAQIGSFVPAESARIGLVDRVFTRVGAIDNLARGQSTFLVEMVETSNILHNATEKSLILLDEVGRGTSTFDGLSIAWSVVEYINEHNHSRTVFATHYHELTGLAALYDKIFNCQVAVKRWENEIIFLHKIIPGGCDDSYGIEVARLAGVPRQTLTRARELLRLLESGKFSQSALAKGVHKNIVQRSLFDRQPSEVEEEIRKTDVDHLTPVDALKMIHRLKEKLDEQ